MDNKDRGSNLGWSVENNKQVVKAWLDGKKVMHFEQGQWQDYTGYDTPSIFGMWRVKPEPIVMKACLSLSVGNVSVISASLFHDEPNCIVYFDENTKQPLRLEPI